MILYGLSDPAVMILKFVLYLKNISIADWPITNPFFFKFAFLLYYVPKSQLIVFYWFATVIYKSLETKRRRLPNQPLIRISEHPLSRIIILFMNPGCLKNSKIMEKCLAL